MPWSRLAEMHRMHRHTPASESPVLAEASAPVPLVQLSEVAPEQTEEVQRFIADRFAQAYDAQIRHFLPHLLALVSAAGERMAACGLRAAASEALFLERYLDQSVEQAIAARELRLIRREQIVEIGNLAGIHAGALRLMIPMLTAYLYRQGFSWVVFTGSPRLGNAFSRLGLPLQGLAPARLDSLPEDERADWGRYYEARPQVLYGDIALGYEQLRAHPDAVQWIGRAIDGAGVPA